LQHSQLNESTTTTARRLLSPDIAHRHMQDP
jgi:hypothetical protein